MMVFGSTAPNEGRPRSSLEVDAKYFSKNDERERRIDLFLTFLRAKKEYYYN